MIMVQSTTGSQMRSTEVSFFKRMAPKGEIAVQKKTPLPTPALRDVLAGYVS